MSRPDPEGLLWRSVSCEGLVARVAESPGQSRAPSPAELEVFSALRLNHTPAPDPYTTGRPIPVPLHVALAKGGTETLE